MDHTWIDAKRILSVLEGQAQTGEVLAARACHRQGLARVQAEDSGRDRVVLLGTVGEGGTVAHDAVLTVTPSRVDARCDCASDAWPCRHVLALAHAWATPSRRSPGSGAGGSFWRSTLGKLAPRTRRPSLEAGREVFAHCLELEPGGAGAWSLRLSWRVHRPGPRGPGRGRLVAAASLRRGPPECATAADVRVLERALAAAGATAPAGSGGGAVLVRGVSTDPVLRALSRAPWVYWRGTRETVGFSPLPVHVCLTGERTGEGLWIRAELREPSKSAWGPDEGRIVGASPPWVERDGALRPILGVEEGDALAILRERGAPVPEEDLPAFLGSAVPDLEVRGVAVEVEGLEDRTFVLGEIPLPRLYLQEDEGVLAGLLRFAYGDYEIAAENPEPAVRVGTGPLRAYVRRDMEAEFEATRRLRGAGFRPVEPGRFEIEGEEALDFLRTGLEDLAREWEVFGRDELKRYRVSQASVGIRVRLGADLDWLDLRVEADADGEPLPPDDVVRALRQGSKYVRLGDGSHALLPAQWVERLAPAVEELSLRKGRARLPWCLAPRVEELLEECPQVSYEGRDVWERVISALGGRSSPPPVDPPGSLTATLRPYQVAGFRWLCFMGSLGLGGVLADDMGLGKTVQALAVLLSEVEAGREGPSLVVAPTSVVPNWEAEAVRFAPRLRVLRYQGSDRKSLTGEMEAHHLVITSYAILRRDIRELAGVEWNYVVLDEAQAIKNAATQTARSARRLSARRRLGLTGTPLENHLGELWSQFHFLMPGLLSSERTFARRFAKPIAQGDEGARAELQRRIRPFVLRRLKAEVARDLPEKVESVLLCEMLPEQEQLYRSLLVASRERVLSDIREKGFARGRFSALEALLRLRQVCCHPGILPGDLGSGVPSAKFELFRDFVGEVIEEGHRVLVFSQFVKALGILRTWFEEAGIPHLYLDGRTKDRAARVQRFQEDPSVAAFLVSLKAGGAGLNLTGADYVILYDPWWNPAVETQAADRAHRIGQTRKVFAYKLVTRDSVEEKILTLQQRKRDLTDGLIRSGGDWVEGLSREEIEALFEI